VRLALALVAAQLVAVLLLVLYLQHLTGSLRLVLP